MRQATQIVVLQPPAPTLLVASHVPVWLDTVEMDVCVKVSHIKILTSFYLSHSYIRYKITHVISVSLCVRVCLSALSRSQCITNFDETWHRRLERDVKEPSRWGQNPIRVSPIFIEFYPKIRTYLMGFSNGVLKQLFGVVCGPIIAVQSSNEVAWRPPTPNVKRV